jgi:hypothetical protein
MDEHMKESRNRQCECGSGKKYRWCCGTKKAQQRTSDAEMAGRINPVSGQVPIINFRGENGRITMVPIFPDGDPRNISDPKGLPGKYTVTFLLSRPSHVVVPEMEHKWSDSVRGDSHVAITRPAITPANAPDASAIKIRGWFDNGFFIEFTGLPNEKGYLGQIRSEPFDAENFYDAEQKVTPPLLKILSNWSVHLDIPVYVIQTEAVEIRTGAHSARVFIAPAEARFAVKSELLMKPGSEFVHYASLYREALNSSSPAYRFLCLFKIIEGIIARRNRLAAEAVSVGKKPRSLVERVPSDENVFQKWLDAVYHVREWHQLALNQALPLDIRGKKFNAIIDSDLRPLRNEIAHAIMDSGELGMSADDLIQVEKVDRWLPVTRTIVRRMWKNDFRNEFLSHLPDPED